MKKLDFVYICLLCSILLYAVGSLDYNSYTGFHLTGFAITPPNIEGPCPCEDGTGPGECSYNGVGYGQPWFCMMEFDPISQDNVCRLYQNCQICGCSGDESCSPDGTCLSVENCSDDTPLNQCSSNKPYYCIDGELIENCNECGCPQDELCDTSGQCVSLPSKTFEDIGEINIQNIDAKIKEIPDYSSEIIKRGFDFNQREMGLIKFIKPILIKKLPEKPDIIILNDTTEYIQKSPFKEQKIIRIGGFKKLPFGVSLSPGEREKEFELILGVTKDNKPLISLNF